MPSTRNRPFQLRFRPSTYLFVVLCGIALAMAYGVIRTAPPTGGGDVSSTVILSRLAAWLAFWLGFSSPWP